MNFLSGKILAENGGIVFDEGTVKLKLPASKLAAIKDLVGKQASLGIRPENLSIIDSSATAENVMAVHVDVSEPLGENTDLYVSTAANKSMVARVESKPGLNMGIDLRLSIDMAKTHVFEPGFDALNRTVAA
jgi:multiple sugar transport system ATP-binding protein